MFVLIAIAIYLFLQQNDVEFAKNAIVSFANWKKFRSKSRLSTQRLFVYRNNLNLWIKKKERCWIKSSKTLLNSRKRSNRKRSSFLLMIYSLTFHSNVLKFHQISINWISLLKLSQKFLTVREIFLWFLNVFDMFVLFSLNQIIRLTLNFLLI